MYYMMVCVYSNVLVDTTIMVEYVGHVHNNVQCVNNNKTTVYSAQGNTSLLNSLNVLENVMLGIMDNCTLSHAVYVKVHV